METLFTNKNFIRVSTIFVGLLCLLALSGLFRGVGGYKQYDKDNQNTISFSGEGEVYATPDIANVYFNISEDGKTVKEAQDKVAVIEQKALEFLKSQGVEDKDIKAENSSFYPKYEYKYDAASLMPCTQYGCPPRPGKNVIVGYTASESITVKIRNIDTTGEIIQGLGTTGVSDLNGPNFAIDDEDALKAQARKLAIEDAENKAKVLAKDLGVRLGKITSFSESGDYPMMYAKYEADAIGMGGANMAPAPQLPKGQNKITSNVTITYQLR